MSYAPWSLLCMCCVLADMSMGLLVGGCAWCGGGPCFWQCNERKKEQSNFIRTKTKRDYTVSMFDTLHEH